MKNQNPVIKRLSEDEDLRIKVNEYCESHRTLSGVRLEFQKDTSLLAIYKDDEGTPDREGYIYYPSFRTYFLYNGSMTTTYVEKTSMSIGSEESDYAFVKFVHELLEGEVHAVIAEVADKFKIK